jgi:hypothetical protein
MALNKKMVAAGLIESLVAMVLLTFCIGFGISLFSGVMTSSGVYRKIVSCYSLVPLPGHSKVEHQDDCKKFPGLSVSIKSIAGNDGRIIYQVRSIEKKRMEDD